MKTTSITGTLRENVGKKFTKQLRKEEKIPCVLYGKGQKNIHFSLAQNSLSKLIYTPEVYLIKINIDGKNFEVIIKDIQFHPVSDKILHVDFQQIFPDCKVKIKIPVRLKGSAIGVTQGGRLILYKRYLTLKSFPDKFPDSIELDVSNLNIGHSIKVQEVQLDNFDIIERKNEVIVAVKVTRVVEEEKPAEAEKVSAEGEKVHAEGEKVPAEGEKAPAKGEKAPAKTTGEALKEVTKETPKKAPKGKKKSRDDRTTRK